jgi:16S rRNA (uracil1498-N3)-methyltransferase
LLAQFHFAGQCASFSTVDTQRAGFQRTPRLYVPASLAAGEAVTLKDQQSHYLLHVLRLQQGATFRLFNAVDGEWLAEITSVRKRDLTMRCDRRLREPQPPPDIDYLFAPLKHARLDYLAQKATEMGAGRLRPVITRRTVVERVNMERLRSNVIEAAEQCNLVGLPQVMEPQGLAEMIAQWDPARRLIYCDEASSHNDPLSALREIKPGPLALLIGPEGGFAPDEQALLKAQSFVSPISLGPRIIRSDTAAVAALALLQATLGDWR